LQQYAAAHGHLPAGITGEVPRSPTPFMGWQTRLLPYIERGELWDATIKAYAAQPNFLLPAHIGLSTAIPLYGCPTDPRTRSPQTVQGGVVRGLTSYLGVNGQRSFFEDGVLYYNSRVRLSDVTDGASSTIAVGERPPSPDMILGWWYAGWGQDKDGEAEMLLGSRTKQRYSRYRDCPVGPYHFEPGKLTNNCDVFHFWSPHSGGAHFLFADGSVHFLRYSADSILPALSTRAGGESVEAIP
jgi:prepilin-type processing-associated H-X9-DG protein